MIASLLCSLTITPHLSLAMSSKPAPQASNPIIWADVPDISIVRAGRNYYMSSTTMHMSPGLPIMKSTDLVNWRMVSYGYERLAENDSLNLENGRNAYGAGTWASSLRHHKGVFYAATFSNSTGKSYIYSTKSPEKEPWKLISTLPFMHDLSLFFDDDGRVYMIHGGGDIRLTELNPDLSAIKPGGIDKVIVPKAAAVAGGQVGLPAEGSQMLKVDGRYYLSNITWPRGGMRTQIIHRADSLTGPYEGRVLLKDRGIAQGSLIDTPDGRWFAYLFRDFGAVGRIPYLVPVTWKDGWPEAGVDGKAPDLLEIKADNIGVAGIVASDEFSRNGKEPLLPLAWQWNHNPVNTHWSLSARPGWLRLTTDRVVPDVVSSHNILTQRTFGPASSAQTKLDFSGMKEGDVAGIVAFQRKYGFIGVAIKEGKAALVMVSAQSGQPAELDSVPLSGSTVHLRIDCDFRERKDEAAFFYSLNGKEWKRLGEALHMTYDMPHFMGYRFGLFSFATKSAGGWADFDWFRIGP